MSNWKDGDSVFVHIDSWAGRLMLPAVLAKACPKRSRVRYVGLSSYRGVGRSVPNQSMTARDEYKSPLLLDKDSELSKLVPAVRS